MNTCVSSPEPDEAPIKIPSKIASVSDTNTAPLTPFKPAWSPTAIAWFCVIFMVLPAGIMYALNYDRLGQPEKKKRALLSVLIGSGIYYFLVTYISLQMDINAKVNAYANSFRVWFVIISIGFAWDFFLRQQRFFAAHIRQGGRKAALYLPLLLSLLWLAVYAAGVTGFSYLMQVQDIKEFDRAMVLMEKDRKKEAERILKGFKDKYPQDTAASWNLAIIYLETNRVPLAKQELRELLRREPHNKEARDFLQDIEDH